MSPNESKKKTEADVVGPTATGPAPLGATSAPRSTPRIRFPRLPALAEPALAAMAPHRRAAYLAEKAHQDDWGHLPPQVAHLLRGVTLPPLAVEHHARAAGTDPVHFAAARAFHRWALGQEMSREQYDAAVARVLSESFGL